MMLRFKHYYGHDIFVAPARVLYVEEGGCGSRGACARVRLDNGETISLNDNAERVQAEIAATLEARK